MFIMIIIVIMNFTTIISITFTIDAHLTSFMSKVSIRLWRKNNNIIKMILALISGRISFKLFTLW